MSAFFRRIAARLPKVPPRGLLLTAGLVWLAAGFNIARLGWPGFLARGLSPLPCLVALAVFLAFFLMIFRKLVRRHTGRILAYEEARVMILYFFDKKSYLLMAGMMTFGILLRRSGLVPPPILGPFYVGLGAALMGAGLGFLRRFIRTDPPAAPEEAPGA